jgi:small basic protein
LRHFLVMTVFAALASVVFGAMTKDTPRERVLYGFKVFVEFILFGLVLAWVLYFIPW